MPRYALPAADRLGWYMWPALVWVAVVTAAPAPPPPTALTSLGVLVGTTTVEGADAFLGVRYAEPPLGRLRFKPSRRLRTPWHSPRLATEFGDGCVEFGGGNQTSEDCLTLSVWRPHRATTSAEDDNDGDEPLLPVLYWIHGGSMIVGSVSDPSMDGAKLALRSNVVVVSVNYRLGPLGFFSHPDLAKEEDSPGSGGLNGIHDQIVGLEYVRDEIRAFGGDPNRVTIFGESAVRYSRSTADCMLHTADCSTRSSKFELVR